MWNANSLDDDTGLPRYCGCLLTVHGSVQCIWVILPTDHISAYVSQRERWTEKHVILMVDTGNKRMSKCQNSYFESPFLVCSLTLRSKWNWKCNTKPESISEIHLTVWTGISHCRVKSVSSLLLFWENKVTETWSQADLEENTLSLELLL